MTFYNPPDVQAVAAHTNIACGHGALAAALQIPLADLVRRELFPPARGISDTMMRDAIERSRTPFNRAQFWPRRGVMQIQFLGPWMNYQAWQPRYAKRHWVASQKEGRDLFVWDINFNEWLPYGNWSGQLERDVWPYKCTGFSMLKGFDLDLSLTSA